MNRWMAIIVLAGSVFLISCGLTESVDVNTPRAARSNYPVVIEEGATRRRRSENAWRLWLQSYRVSPTAPDLEPVLAVPRTLPAAVAQKIVITEKSETLSPEQARDALRQFIARSMRVLAGEPQEREVGLQDLSLNGFSADGNLYRATYRQTSYSFPLANGYGELRIAITKEGALIQLSSRLVPIVELPSAPSTDIAAIMRGLVGREFKYSGIDGRELVYKVASEEEITRKDIVIFPVAEESRILLHLAYPVEVGRGTTWTVFVDAITGQEIAVKQNFNT